MMKLLIKSRRWKRRWPMLLALVCHFFIPNGMKHCSSCVFGRGSFKFLPYLVLECICHGRSLLFMPSTVAMDVVLPPPPWSILMLKTGGKVIWRNGGRQFGEEYSGEMAGTCPITLPPISCNYYHLLLSSINS